MKVFISWSGERSYDIASALYDWLPKVLQAVEPWLSEKDISAGKRWSTEVSKELEGSSVGIICITPENKEAPWILFEAGALSKTLDQTFVCPFVFGMPLSELTGPLTQFQSVLSSEQGTYKLVEMLNKALSMSGNAVKSLPETFKIWWPHLEKTFTAIPENIKVENVRRPNEEIWEEILNNTRELLRKEDNVELVSDGHAEPPRFYRYVFRIENGKDGFADNAIMILEQSKLKRENVFIERKSKTLFTVAIGLTGLPSADSFVTLFKNHGYQVFLQSREREARKYKSGDIIQFD